MFQLLPNQINNKVFYLKNHYSTEQTFNYDLKIHNHISKTGFTMELTDESPWVSGLTNTTELEISGKTEFYSGSTEYITAFDNLTHVFNNIIQISGVNHLFHDDTNINYTTATQIGSEYGIIFNDTDTSTAQLKIMDSGGTYVTGCTWNDNAVSNLNILSKNSITLTIGYYDEVLQKSYLRDITYISGVLTVYDPTFFYNGESIMLKLNHINNDYFSLTYSTPTQGIVQIAKYSFDHIFSLGFPFVYNDDITAFSNSVYQNDNIVIIYYDIENQLMLKNIRIYSGGDYLGIGLPSIIKDDYCYDLGIGVLDSQYVYVSYYDAMNMMIYTSLIKIEDDDVTIVDNAIPLGEWAEDLYLTTISDEMFMLSYMDSGYTGVYRFVELDKTSVLNEDVDYNEFNIDLTLIDTSKLGGHSDYWIYYSNEIVEKGVVYINQKEITYNT